jgi:hypothetical protein
MLGALPRRKRIALKPPDPVTAAAGLAEVLSTLPDPRKRRGVRHGLVTLLSVAMCAVAAGARSCVAIAECAADLPVDAVAALGISAARGQPLAPCPAAGAEDGASEQDAPEQEKPHVQNWTCHRRGVAVHRPRDPVGRGRRRDPRVLRAHVRAAGFARIYDAVRRPL